MKKSLKKDYISGEVVYSKNEFDSIEATNRMTNTSKNFQANHGQSSNNDSAYFNEETSHERII